MPEPSCSVCGDEYVGDRCCAVTDLAATATRLAEAEALLRRWLDATGDSPPMAVDTATFLAGGDPDA